MQCCLTEIDVVLLACRKHIRKASRKQVAVNGYAKNRFFSISSRRMVMAVLVLRNRVAEP